MSKFSKYSINEEFFSNINSISQAYILGLLYADGNISKNMDYFQISLIEEDKETIDYIKNKLNYGGPLSLKYKSLKYLNVCKPQWQLKIYNIKIVKQLIEIGCVPKKSLILKFPKNLQQNLLSHFVRGYFDGDGSIYYSSHRHAPVISIIGSYDFMYKLYEYIPCSNKSIRQKNKKVSPENSTHELIINKLSEIQKFCEWIYTDADFYIKRKHNIFLKIKDIKLTYGKGKHLSEKTKEKLRKANTGKNNPMFGKHRIIKTKKQISKSMRSIQQHAKSS